MNPVEPPPANSLVVTMSDFGDSDGYAAVMSGVIRSYSGSLSVVPGPHRIRPFSVSSGAYVLSTLVPAFPEGTTFVAVVDPGVGTNRGVTIGNCQSRIIVAPDNGLLSFLEHLAVAPGFLRRSVGLRKLNPA